MNWNTFFKITIISLGIGFTVKYTAPEWYLIILLSLITGFFLGQSGERIFPTEQYNKEER